MFGSESKLAQSILVHFPSSERKSCTTTTTNTRLPTFFFVRHASPLFLFFHPTTETRNAFRFPVMKESSPPFALDSLFSIRWRHPGQSGTKAIGCQSALSLTGLPPFKISIINFQTQELNLFFFLFKKRLKPFSHRKGGDEGKSL